MKVMFLIILFLLAASSAFAVTLSVPIPCQNNPVGGQCAGSATNISDPATYVARIYQFGLIAAGITALGAIVFGAIKYILSAGGVYEQKAAKEQILSAIYGLLLLFGAYLILNTINPALVKLKNPGGQILNVPSANPPASNPLLPQNSTTNQPTSPTPTAAPAQFQVFPSSIGGTPAAPVGPPCITANGRPGHFLGGPPYLNCTAD